MKLSAPKCLLPVALLAGCGEDEPVTLAGPNPDSPVVAGFERLHRQTGDLLAGGRLLAGELGCASCHAVPRGRELLDTKRAPRLETVAERVHPARLRALIADPHGTKPGTTMPDLWGNADLATKREDVDALVHFLVSLSPGRLQLQATDEAAAQRGAALFDRIGCAACHDPMGSGAEALPSGSVPLPEMANRYSLDGLVRFLLDPLSVRPSGRMPSLDLSEAEATDLAHTLLRGTDVPGALRYAVYRGRFEGVEGLEGLAPDRTGVADGFHPDVARRQNDFGIRFEGFVEVPRAGRYTFHLRAEHRARLWIDGELLADAQGRPERRSESSGTRELESGWHEITVAYVQRRNDSSLSIEWEGPDLPRGPFPREGLRHSLAPSEAYESFVVDASKAARGREVFTARNCAACHTLEDRVLAGPEIAMVHMDRGCLAEDVGTAPDFRLDGGQRRALGAFLAAMGERPPPSPQQRVAEVMAAWNCYACHERNGRGGVTEERDRFFLANREDLGEEGRLPPSLDGVGDRLRPDWLARVLGDGVAVRTYMATRMPRFRAPEVEALAGHYRALDRQPSLLPHSPDDAAVREAGRLLVGEGGMNCILCHDFHRREAPTMGVHDLITTTARLNEDWFVRYLKNPERYHPGTRMPNFWPFGRSALAEVLDGDANRQIRAIWTYLSDGDQAVDPEGLGRQNRELIVGGHAVVYRGKFWEAGWRGIAVGYPSGLNLVFDAENLRLALLWKGRFLDVSRHWNVQGMGLIRPLGEDVRVLPGGRPFAVLASEDMPWPEEQGWRTAPYRFQGYDLDRLGHPTFRYQYMGVAIEDRPEVRVGDENLALVRTLSFTAEESVPEIWFRLARGERIEQIDRSAYRIDGELTVRIPGLRQPVIAVDQENALELRLPLRIPVGMSELVVEYIW